MLQLRADVLVGALRVGRHPLEVLLDLRVVIDLEVVGLVDMPVEVVVPDPVLAKVGDVGGLGCDRRRHEAGDRKLDGAQENRKDARAAHAHRVTSATTGYFASYTA